MAEMTNEELTGVLLSLMGRVGALESGGVTPTPGPSGDTELPEEWTTLATTFVSYLTTNDIYSGVVGDNVITADNAWTFFMMGVNAALLNLDRDKLEAADINAGLIRSAVLDVLNTTTIQTLMADYIKASDIVTGTLRTDTLLATVAQFCQMISNTVSAQGIQSFVIDSDHVHFQNASIKNAAIESVEAGKITSGAIDTSKVSIRDEDDYVVIADGLIQMCDEEYVRVQIGHIADEDDDDGMMFDMRIWDADGNMMWSASGITADAIKSAIIVDDMVAHNANISASKINIASVIQRINSMGGVTTSASNITIDADNHTLSAWLQTMDSWKVGQADRLDTLETEVELIDGQLSTFASKTQLTTISNGLSQLQTDYTTFKQTYNSFQTIVQESITETQEMIPDTSGLSSAIGVLQGQVSNLHNYDDTQLRTALNTLQTTVNGLENYDDTAITQQITAINEAIADLDIPDVSGIESAIADLESSVGDVTAMRTALTNLQTAVAGLENYDDSALQASIAALQSAVDDLENYDDAEIRALIAQLRTDVDAIEIPDIDALQDALDDLAATVGTLTTTVTTNNTTITQRVDGIAANISSITSSITTLQNTDIALQNTVEAYNTSIEANASAIEVLQNKQFVDETVLQQTYAEYVSEFSAEADLIRLEMQSALSNGYVPLETFNRWFSIDTSGLTIGSSDSPVQLHVSNDGITFTQDDTEIGFWDGNLFHARNMKIDVNYYAQFGSFRWVPKTDGSLVLQKV